MLYLKTEVFDWSDFKNIKARRGLLKKNYQLPHHPHLWLWYSIAASQVSGKKSEKAIQKIFTLNNSNGYNYKNHIMKNHLLFVIFPFLSTTYITGIIKKSIPYSAYLTIHYKYQCGKTSYCLRTISLQVSINCLQQNLRVSRKVINKTKITIFVI